MRVSESGLGDGLFANWRLRPDGSPDPDFILNREPWTRAEILLAEAFQSDFPDVPQIACFAIVVV